MANFIRVEGAGSAWEHSIDLDTCRRLALKDSRYHFCTEVCDDNCIKDFIYLYLTEEGTWILGTQVIVKSKNVNILMNYNDEVNKKFEQIHPVVALLYIKGKFNENDIPVPTELTEYLDDPRYQNYVNRIGDTGEILTELNEELGRGPSAADRPNKLGNPENPLPSWDKDSFHLTFRGWKKKVLTRSSPRQVALLDAFEAANWKSPIHNPFKHNHLLTNTIKDMKKKSERGSWWITFRIHDGMAAWSKTQHAR